MDPEKAVLIVEDNEALGIALREILEMHGYRVYSGCSAREAMAILEAHHPALIILDVMMPEIGGLTFLRSMRMDQQFDETKVVVVSGRVAEEDKQAASDAGADGFIEKPLSMDELLLAVRHFFPIN